MTTRKPAAMKGSTAEPKAVPVSNMQATKAAVYKQVVENARSEPAQKATAKEAVTKDETKAPKAERGPRGDHRARHGVVLEDGSIVMLAFNEFECAKGETGWTTICVAHGTRHPAGTKAEAEKAGARKARAGWCKGCAKAK